jgi:hypothetical protein
VNDVDRTTSPYDILVVSEVVEDLMQNVWFFEPAQVIERERTGFCPTASARPRTTAIWRSVSSLEHPLRVESG